MAAGVFGEVITAHEPAVAYRTDKFLLPGVRPPMTGQLVGAGEPLVAAVPATAEGLLTCVRAEVGFEVGAFEVGLPAAGEVADVVSPAGEVHFRSGAPRPSRDIDRGWSQR